MDHSTLAAQLFLDGCSCSQAVMAAFCDVTGMDRSTALRLTAPFGGGIGRMREVCGAVSGMMMVVGLLYGFEPSQGSAAKSAHYHLVQELAEQFRQQAGSIICREILKNPPADPNPSPRTAEYYASRPCARMVMLAAEILDKYIAEHPVEDLA